MLSLHVPSQHVALYVPGEPLAASIQFLHETRLPSPENYRLGTPDVTRFRGLLVHLCYDLLSCLPPLQEETFTPGLSTVWSPSPLPGMTTVATGQFPPAELSPLERQLASLHAPPIGVSRYADTVLDSISRGE